MELSVKQRLNLESVLVSFTEGKYEQLKAKKSIVEKITFSSEELQEIEFKTEPQGNSLVYKWNSEKETIKEVEFIELETSLIKEILVKIDTEGKLNEQLFDIYELFVVEHIKIISTGNLGLNTINPTAKLEVNS